MPSKPTPLHVERIYLDVGERIRTNRDRARLTQTQVAARARLSRTSITNIEAGRQAVLLHQLYRIAAAINVPPADLLPNVEVANDVAEEIPEDISALVAKITANIEDL